jgi:hypothetical protein
MMASMKDHFYVEDEPLEDVRHAWKSGEPVLVITSRLRIRARAAAHMARDLADQGRRRAARAIEPPRKPTASPKWRGQGAPRRRASSGRRVSR